MNLCMSHSDKTIQRTAQMLSIKGEGANKYVKLGTCESFVYVRIESRIELAVRFDFESNFRIESAVYTMHIPSVFILYLSRTRVMHATEYLLFISIQS